MGFCEDVSKVADDLGGDVEEDIFAVKKKNTYDDKIGIADIVDSKDEKPNSEEDVASKNKNKGVKNHQEEEEDKLPNQPAKHEEEVTSKKKKPEETKNETNSEATLPLFTVVEVKVVQGTSDVVLVNGQLRVGDRIVVAGLQGPVDTSISALLTRHPVKKLRHKGEYLHHKKIKISQGIKIAAPGLEHAIAGASIYIVRPNDDIEVIKKSAMAYVNSVMSRIEKKGEGVYVQASTLASVEALLDFSKAREVNVPMGGMSIGAVHKKDVMRVSAMLEKKREYAAILALGVEVTPEASQLAHQLGVKIFTSAMAYVNSGMSRIDKSGEGVYVQASTLESVQVLLDFLKTPEVNIPVSSIRIGAVEKKDVMEASAMLEKKREYAAILALGVEVTPEASQLAHQLGVKIFTSDDISRLLLLFKSQLDYKDKILPVFPCVLKIMPNSVFNAKDPIVLDVHVVEGIAKIGTPLCIPGREFAEIGWIVYIKDDDHRVLDYAMKGQRVTINILGGNPEELQKMFGRDFEMEDELVSKITPDSVYALRKQYMGDLFTEDNILLFKMKQLFKI